MKLPSFLNFFSDDLEGVENNKMFNTSEVAAKVNLNEASVRRYALALENELYYIYKDINNRWMYTNNDIEIIIQIKQLIDDTGVSLKDATKNVVSKANDKLRKSGDINEAKESKDINADIEKHFQSLAPMNYYSILRDEMRYMKTDFQKIEEILKNAKESIESNMELIDKLENLEEKNKKLQEEVLFLKTKLESITNMAQF